MVYGMCVQESTNHINNPYDLDYSNLIHELADLQ